MIKELLIKLNVIIQQFKNSSDSHEQTIQKDIVDEKTSTTETALKKDISIVVSEQNNIHKIEISDFISPWDYEEIKNSSSKYKALDKLCSFVLWNSSRQKVNKGTYYIINKGKNCQNNCYLWHTNAGIAKGINNSPNRRLFQKLLILFGNFYALVNIHKIVVYLIVMKNAFF